MAKFLGKSNTCFHIVPVFSDISQYFPSNIAFYGYTVIMSVYMRIENALLCLIVPMGVDLLVCTVVPQS